MSPRIAVRTTPAPATWGSLKPGMAWHHIIPFAVLQKVWNRLVDQFIGTQLPESRTAIRQYLLLCGAKEANLEALIDRMRALNQTQRRAGHHHLPFLEDGDVLKLQEYAVWPAWNVVEGPRNENRTDDPADIGLDRFRCGLTPQESARMRTVENLFRQFEAFIAGGANPAATSLRTLAQEASIARPSLQGALPIRFRAEMWAQDGAGKWRKRR